MQQKFKLNEWVIVWLKTYKKIMLKPSTYESYVGYAVNVTCETFIDELSVFDIQCMVNDMVCTGRSVSTIKHMLTITRQSLVKARKLGLVSDLSCMEGIELPRARKKPVIVATQMLHSMIENPRPTRAEVTDVANAIFQSTDAIMLSGETASGKYPIEAVKTMCSIALEAEETIDTSLDLNLEKITKPIEAVLARSLVAATMTLPVKALIFDTWTGRTGRYLAEFRPKVPIYAMCYNSFTMRELALTYDIYGYPFEVTGTKEGFVQNSLKILLEDGKISKGDLVGFIGGSFNDELGATYMEFKYV